MTAQDPLLAHTPKYYAVMQDLLDKIQAGLYHENDRLPSEYELQELYQVSRITVRRALDELVRSGYLYRSQGKGTFIKVQEYNQEIFSIMSCTQDIERLGKTPCREVLRAEVLEAPASVAARLELGDATEVFRLERVYSIDDTPINHMVSYLPYRPLLGIDTYDFSTQSLYATLQKDFHVTLTDAIRTIEAQAADKTIARHLHISPGTPIIFFSCITHGEIHGHRIPLEYFDCSYRSDKFKFYIHQLAR